MNSSNKEKFRKAQEILTKCTNFRILDEDLLQGSNPVLHCISADRALSSGVARSLDRFYGLRQKLPYDLELGNVYRVESEGRVIYNLVTKLECTSKPRMQYFKSTIRVAATLLSNLDIKEIDIPALGTGRDNLDPSEVFPFLQDTLCSKFKVNLYLPKLGQRVSLVSGKDVDYFTNVECKGETLCCGLPTFGCKCKCWSGENLERFNLLCDLVAGADGRRLEGIGRDIFSMVQDLEDQSCSPKPVLGFDGFVYCGKPRIVYYGEIPGKSFTAFPFPNGRAAWWFLRKNLFMLFTPFFVPYPKAKPEKPRLPSPKPIKKTEWANVVKKVAPKKPLVVPPPANVPTVAEPLKVVGASLNEEKPKRIIKDGVLQKPKVVKKKKTDFDKKHYKEQVQKDAKDTVNPGEKVAPTSMKVIFAKDLIANSRKTELKYECTIQNVHGNLKQHLYDGVNCFRCGSGLDAFIFEMYASLVERRSWKMAMEDLYSKWYRGELKDRNLWYRISTLAKAGKVPDVMKNIEDLKIKNPYRRRYMRDGKRAASFFGGKHCLADVNDNELLNFVNYLMLFSVFRDAVRKELGNKDVKIDISPNILLNLYLQECTSYFLRPTIGPFDDITAAAKKVKGINVKNVNKTVEEAQAFLKRSKITMGKLDKHLDNFDFAALNSTLGTLHSMMSTSQGFIEMLTTPMMDKALDWLGESFGVPKELMKGVKTKMTPLNIGLATWAFIVYQHTDSLVLRTMVVLLVLKIFGMLDAGISFLKKFLKGFSDWYTSDTEPRETMNVFGLSSLIGAIISGSGTLVKGLIGGFASAFGATAVTARAMRYLLAKTGAFGRDLNFTFLGLSNAPKLARDIISSFKVVVAWLFGGKRPVSPTNEWLMSFDNWKILLHVLEDARINNLLRINEEARKCVDKLYDDGVELMRKARSLSARPSAQLNELTRLMSRAKTLQENVTHYREYSSKKITPYSICLTSAAGVGKTNAVHIFKHLFHRFVYPDIEPDSLVYNVPLDGDHMDGYTKQKIMVCDDYNLIDDPTWVAKLAPLVSNVPRVLPMSHLQDKGIVQESDVIIKTTNNAYLIPLGVTHGEATLRRNNIVVHVEVPPWTKVGGRVNKDAIIDFMTRQYLSTSEDPEEAVRRAVAYYENMEYYTFILKDVMVDRPIKTMKASEFFTFVVNDFTNHRRREEELLRANATVPVDAEEIRNMVGYTEMLEGMRSEFQAAQNRLREILVDDPDLTQEYEGQIKKLVDILRRRSSEARRALVEFPSSLLSDTFELMRDYIALHRVQEMFNLRFNGDLQGAIRDITEEVRSSEEGPVELEGFDPENDPIPEIPDEDPVQETMFSLFYGSNSISSDTGSESDRDSVTLSDNSMEENEVTRMGNFDIVVRGNEYLVRFDPTVNRTTLSEEYENDDVEPRFGWLDREFYTYCHHPSGGEYIATQPAGVRPVPLPQRMATEFVMRLRSCREDRPFIDDENYSDDTSETWELVYKNDNMGIGTFQLDRECSWFKESMWCFSFISVEERYRLLSLRVEMVEDYLHVRESITRIVVRNPPVVRTGFVSDVAAVVGKSISVILLTVLCLAVYYAFILALIWLFCPRPKETATQYLVDPTKRAAKLKWVTTSSVTEVSAVRKKLQSNMQLIAREGEDPRKVGVAQLFYVSGTYALAPRHFFYDYAEKDVWRVVTTSPEFPDLADGQVHLLEKDDVHIIPGKDAVLVNIRGSGRCFRNAIKHFYTDDDLNKIEGTKIRIYQRDPQTHEVSMATSNVRSLTSLTLKSLPEEVLQCVYTGGVECGSSGGPVFNLDPNCPRSICGIQSATTTSWGSFTPVTREDIEKIFENLQLPQFADLYVDEELTECVRTQELANCELLGSPANEIFTNTVVVGFQKLENVPSLMAKSSLKPTLIADILPLTGREPAILNPCDTRRAEFLGKPHYLHKSLNKFCADKVTPPDPSDVKAAVYGLSYYNDLSGGFEGVKTLTLEEAIHARGLDCSSLDLSTSAGLPWSLKRDHVPGKRKWIEVDELTGSVKIANELRKACEEFMRVLSENTIPAYLQNDFMKDELRDATLGKQNVTRLVTVLPLHVLLVGRQLMLDYHSRIHTLAKRAAPICVGVNIESRSAHLMVQKLCSRAKGKNCFDFDASNWDGHFPFWMIEMIIKVRNYSYSMHDQCYRTEIARANWLRAMFYGYVQIGPFVYQKYRGMSSGSCGTAEDNSEGHFGLVYIVWRRLCRASGRLDLLDFRSFLEHVVVFIYGDDICYSVSDEVVGFFNGLTVAEQYRQLGWPITPARKGDDLVKTKSWEDLTFLKRNFTYDPFESIVLAPLEILTIRSLFSWQRGTELDQFYSNLKDAFRFLVHHGKREFENTRTVVNTALKAKYLPPVCFTYEDLRLAWSSNYDNL